MLGVSVTCKGDERAAEEGACLGLLREEGIAGAPRPRKCPAVPSGLAEALQALTTALSHLAMVQQDPAAGGSHCTMAMKRESRSQFGPIRARHLLRQQRREKKPYSRPEIHPRTSRLPAPSAGPSHPAQ